VCNTNTWVDEQHPGDNGTATTCHRTATPGIDVLPGPPEHRGRHRRGSCGRFAEVLGRIVAELSIEGSSGYPRSSIPRCRLGASVVSG
jgi:hypothetical protein